MCLNSIFKHHTNENIGFCHISCFSHDPFKNNFVTHPSHSDSCLTTMHSNSNLSSYLAHLHPCKAPTEIIQSIHMQLITYKWLNGSSRSTSLVNFMKICQAFSIVIEITNSNNCFIWWSICISVSMNVCIPLLQTCSLSCFDPYTKQKNEITSLLFKLCA